MASCRRKRDEGDAFLARSARSTRGNRMDALIAGQEEAEGDDEFWGQDFFGEEEEDEAYEEESDVERKVFKETLMDSDFFDSSSEEEGGDEEETLRKEERAAKRAKGVKAPGAKKKAAKKAAPPRRENSKANPSPAKPAARRKEPRTVHFSDGGAGLRKSSRSLVLERDAQRAEAQKQDQRKRPATHRKVEYVQLTQEELLAEAAKTEIVNLASLRALQKREEEVKARARETKKPYTGPVVRYRSSRGKNTIQVRLKTDERVDPKVGNWMLQEELGVWNVSLPLKVPVKPVCVVTGRPAKYRDPRSGQPYADARAYKVLREGAVEKKKVQEPAKVEPSSIIIVE